MTNSGVFRTVDILALYFGKSMSDDNRGALSALNYLLKISNTEDLILPYNIQKLQALLRKMLPWLANIRLSYYDKAENADINFHELTETEKKNKQLWIENIIRTYGKESKLRCLTDIERAFLRYD